jgi:hypothetical protein
VATLLQPTSIIPTTKGDGNHQQQPSHIIDQWIVGVMTFLDFFFVETKKSVLAVAHRKFKMLMTVVAMMMMTMIHKLFTKRAKTTRDKIGKIPPTSDRVNTSIPSSTNRKHKLMMMMTDRQQLDRHGIDILLSCRC